MASRLPDELLKLILVDPLRISDDAFASTAFPSPFSQTTWSSSHLLAVCKRWMRVAIEEARRAEAAAPFAHGAVHQAGRYRLYDSYHCSRYNTNTGVLTPKMFRSVFARIKTDLG